ncbi:MAG: sugar transferase [Candidatus Kapaibacteriota bacterium]
MKEITQNNLNITTQISENIQSKKNIQNDSFFNNYLFKKLYPYLSILFTDFLAVLISFSLQYYLSFNTGFFGKQTPSYFNHFDVIALAFLLVYFYWGVLFFVFGLYKNWYESSPFDEFYLVLKTVIFGSLIGYVLIITDTTKSPRILIFFHSISLIIFTLAFRLIIRNFYKNLLKSQKIYFNTIVVGFEENIKKITSQILQSPAWGYKVINTIDLNLLSKYENKKLIIEKLEQLLGNSTEIVIISTNNNKINNNEIDFVEIVNYLAEKNIRIKIESNLYDTFTGITKQQNIYGIPFLEINPQILKPWQTFAKRAFDIIFSLAVIIIGMPFWILVALIITIESKGGIFYTQPRYGKDGKVFQIFKFRSMVANTHSQSFWTVKNDNRVTKFGRFIRKTHLDEIPQFLNVLLGDMSVVGPRPEQPKIADLYHEKMPIFKRRLKVRPGITGWWQIKYINSEINDEEMESRLKDDFYYIENLSLKFDFEIIIRTVWCVIVGHGQT